MIPRNALALVFVLQAQEPSAILDSMTAPDAATEVENTSLPTFTSVESLPSQTYHWQDFDRDGLRDVYVRRSDRDDRLLRNQGSSFVDVTESYGLAELRSTVAVSWIDVEADGLADLHLLEADGQSRLFHNAATSFVEVTGSAGISHEGPALFHEWIDDDRDHLLDLHVVTPTHDILFENQGRGRFAAVLLPTGGIGSPAAWVPTNAPGAREVPHPKFDASSGSRVGSSGVDLGRSARSSAGARTTPHSLGSESVGTCGTTTIDDQGAAGCLQASTTPTLGLLYPLSTDLNVDGTGQVGIGTTSPTQKLDVDGTIRSRSGGIEFPDGSTQTSSQTLDGSFAYGAGNDPTGTLQFLAPPATVTVVTGQKVSVTSNKGLGSRFTQGACCLSLWVGYRLLPSGPISVLGGGIVGNKVNRNTRTVMGVNGILTGLAPGTYEVGMVGGTGDLHWDFNGSGYTSALVFD